LLYESSKPDDLVDEGLNDAIMLGANLADVVLQRVQLALEAHSKLHLTLGVIYSTLVLAFKCLFISCAKVHHSIGDPFLRVEKEHMIVDASLVLKHGLSDEVPIEKKRVCLQQVRQVWVLDIDLLEGVFADGLRLDVGEAGIEELGAPTEHHRHVSYHSLLPHLQGLILLIVNRVADGVFPLEDENDLLNLLLIVEYDLAHLVLPRLEHPQQGHHERGVGFVRPLVVPRPLQPQRLSLPPLPHQSEVPLEFIKESLEEEALIDLKCQNLMQYQCLTSILISLGSSERNRISSSLFIA
jgi:hypothetical protein